MGDELVRLEQLRLLGLGQLPEPVKPKPPKSIGGWTVEPIELPAFVFEPEPLPAFVFEPIEVPDLTIDEVAIDKLLRECIVDGEAILELLKS